MIAEPKARSQGSNGAGGGALAFTAMSAASAELAVTANTAAARTSFFMTIPISLLEQSGLVAPRNRKVRLRPNLTGKFGPSHARSEGKKASICRLFRRLGLFARCCWRVLHSHHNFAPPGRLTGCITA